jgi:hypothetical protein
MQIYPNREGFQICFEIVEGEAVVDELNKYDFPL